MSVRAIWPVATEGAEIGFLMNTRDTTIPDMIRKLVFLFLFFIPYQLQFFSVFGCISIFFRGLLLSRVIVSLSRFKLYSNTPTQDVDWTSVITSSTEKHMQKDVCMCVCMRVRNHFKHYHNVCSKRAGSPLLWCIDFIIAKVFSVQKMKMTVM